MAKQLVNPIERHVEKGILGLSVLLLIAAVAMFLVTTPNQFELEGTNVTPGSIEKKLTDKANAVRNVIRDTSSPVEIPEPLLPAFEAELDPYARANLPTELPVAVAIGPDVPIVDRGSMAPGQAELVELVDLSPPAVALGRSTFLLPGAGGQMLFRPANWVTVAALFDVKEQTARQKRAYGAARKDVIFGPPRLQRRTQRRDGSWSEDDWEEIDPWPSHDLRPAPSVLLVDDGGDLIVPREVEDRLNNYVNELMEPARQLDLLRPYMIDKENGDAWSFPVLTSRRDVVTMDQQYLFPDDPSAAVEDRYAPEEVAVSLAGGGTQVSAADRIKQAFVRYHELIRRAKANQSDDDARSAFNVVFSLSTDDEATPSDRARAAKLAKDAERLDRDLTRMNRRGRSRKTKQGTPQATKARERQPHPTQQLWVHDASPGSVESGTTYQYRLGVRILNGLLAEPEKLRDKQEATVVFVKGAWSEPVEVSIPEDTLFFVTGKDPRKQAVAVEFFKWEDGLWVKSRRFKLSVGDRLAGRARVPLPAPDDPNEVYNAEVEFEADGTVIDIDFEHAYRERKKVAASRTGVKFASPSKACSVVYMDASGRLHERFVPTDKANPEKKQALGMLWRK